ncbi:hypothetical protein ST201phi2-1p077 [Pseudomonas phage 201phi2-1]|uniref:Uncharacterized protein n=1 Tax=Pseudomonas phage 201phi2-1 TaxID=198110 RepID=B3FK52_BP201|nr:hypothetical protein ST201phi2-1p077 [Pseudomonas phage 201phi2-1]ABY62910.1 hypothetical protein 201phi2-1p077 [Pseudomonas phage 201phi2-1]
MYGDKLGLVELLGDKVGLSVSDINDSMIAYFEYNYFNCPFTFSDKDIVDQYFMGDPMGYDLLYAVNARFPEINAYIPDGVKSIRYARTLKDGFYLICEPDDEHVTDVRLNPLHQTFSEG